MRLVGLFSKVFGITKFAAQLGVFRDAILISIKTSVNLYTLTMEMCFPSQERKCTR
jgi:hypothetical protein